MVSCCKKDSGWKSARRLQPEISVKLDRAIANNRDETIGLFVGNGDRNFRPASGSPYTVGPDPVAMRACKLDVAVANNRAMSILVSAVVRREPVEGKG